VGISSFAGKGLNEDRNECLYKTDDIPTTWDVVHVCIPAIDRYIVRTYLDLTTVIQKDQLSVAQRFFPQVFYSQLQQRWNKLNMLIFFILFSFFFFFENII